MSSRQTKREEVLKYFLCDIARHEVSVLLNQGRYRHLRCQAPGTWNQGFNIVTYPGSLVFSGDMGCFVFERLDDMFEFFRDGKPRGSELKINPDYWSEKLVAVEGNRRGGSAEVFSDKLFESAVLRDLKSWLRSNRHDTSKEDRRELWDEVIANVIGAENDHGGTRKQIAAHDFHWKSSRVASVSFYFADFGEHSLANYTHRFLWCCYALVWAIREFDHLTPSKEAS